MNRAIRGIRIVFKKEIKDSLRDRRSLMTAMLPALLAPMLMIFLFHSIAKTRDTSDVLNVQVIGQENAPDLIQYLSERDISFTAYDGNAKQDIQSGDIEIVLEIPDDFAEKFSASEPASLYLHSDVSIEKSEAAAGRLGRLIRGYGSGIGSMRLMVRGINPAIASAVLIESKDYSTGASRAGQLLGAMQIFILIAAFFGTAPSAIDTTAGERERNSLEPLLIHPLSSLQIMLGKYFAVACFGFLAALITVIATSRGLDFASMESLGIDPKLDLSMQVNIVLVLIPIVFFASALQMLLALFAKTFKEAQSYTALVALLPMMAVLPSLLGAVNDSDWMFSVPLLGQKQLIDQVLRGEGLDLAYLALNAGTTLMVSAIILLVLIRMLRNERVVYGS